jgi:O-antigen ligase
LIIFSIKNFKEFRLFILYGVFQIAIGILLNGFDLSSYRTGAGEPISSGRLGGILLAFGLFYKDSRLKYFRILIGLMGLFFIILSGTRTLYVSFAIIILFFLIYDTKKGRIKISRKSFKKGFLALIGIISIILVLNFNIFKVNSELIDRFYSAFESLSGFSAYDNSTYYRSLQWNSSIEIWRENPIVGSGLGGFAYSWSFADIREYPHNIFLELLAEGGVIAIGLFVGMLSIIWRLVREKSKYLPVYINAFSLSLFLLGLITSLTSLEFPNQFILFLSFILIVTSSNILHNESKMLSQKSLSSNHYHISEN